MTASTPLHLQDLLEGRRILLTGSTGFLGKVLLSMLLHRLPGIGRIHLLIRSGRKSEASAEDRFAKEILGSPALDPVREKWGEKLEDALREKVRIVAGDVSLERFGLSREAFSGLGAETDIVLNCAGLVDFEASLETAIETNVQGPQNALGFAKAFDLPLVHVSTCYVTGRRVGMIEETEPEIDWWPDAKDGNEGSFSAEREIEDAKRIIARVREEAKLQDHERDLMKEARREIEENGDASTPGSLEVAVRLARSRWIKRELAEAGLRRAESWGWPNTYSYSKSLGEQLLFKGRGSLPVAVVRPAVIESAIAYPFPGWNQGVNTSAPLTYLSYRGHSSFPLDKNTVLDVVPVDLAAAALVYVAAACLAKVQKPVYQVGTGTENPFTVGRLVELTGLDDRREHRHAGAGGNLLHRLLAHWEPKIVSDLYYKTFSSPGMSNRARRAGRLVRVAVEGQESPAAKLGRKAAKGLDSMAEMDEGIDRIMRTYRSYGKELDYQFQCTNIRELTECFREEDRRLFPYEPTAIDWRHYWLDVQMPGLRKWSFPEIEERLKKKRKPVRRHATLIDFFEESVERFADSPAAATFDGRTTRSHTYREIQQMAEAAAGSLHERGVEPGDRVLLVARNGPEWVATYFAILGLGASCVPLNPDLSYAEADRFAGYAEARGIIADEGWIREAEAASQRDERPLWSLEEIASIENGTKKRLTPLRRPGDLASLIFTSGTTGKPKGVMLSDANFTAEVAMLQEVISVSPRDRVLSVLPLYHSFEFTSGMLLPFASGAPVTYLSEINPSALREALRKVRPTLMIGVPALFELLWQRIEAEAGKRLPGGVFTFQLAKEVTRSIREALGANVGPLVFRSVHDFFGGRIRFLVSGGAALPEEIQRNFRELGLPLYQGYGTTEASPVISVDRPGSRPAIGTVGEPLPGVEVQLYGKDESGVGEVIVRGPNVMLGYYGDPEATAETIRDGWLHTGDLGRFDGKGNLLIVGRRKETIVDAGGKNIYPDELEEMYSSSPLIAELSVVGLPGRKGGEVVACLVRPEARGGTPPGEIEREIRAHFSAVSAELPHYRRVKVLRFIDSPLPRTATRKVKRGEIVGILEQQRASAGGERGQARTVDPAQSVWIREIVSRVSGASSEDIRAETDLSADLGLDSLRLLEIRGAMEAHLGRTLTDAEAASVSTVGDLARLAAAPSGRRGDVERLLGAYRKDVRTPPLPSTVSTLGRNIIDEAQRHVHDRWMDVRVSGRSHVPRSGAFFVVANHCSHLDFGLVRHALGKYGKNLAILAAEDYFFDKSWKRFIFENFTQVIPIGRTGFSREALDRAVAELHRGRPMLMFPEGTRSKSGRLQPFKSGVGYILARAGVCALPVHIDGTHRALPKGSFVPRSNRFRVAIGPPVSREEIDAAREEGGYPAIARLLEERVAGLGAEGESGRGIGEKRLREIFNGLPRRFVKGAFESPATFYFSLGTEPWEKWNVTVDAERCVVREGKAAGRADCVLVTDPVRFSEIMEGGKLPSFQEAVAGGVKTNDPEALLRFHESFSYEAEA